MAPAFTSSGLGRTALRAPALITDLMKPPLLAYAGSLELAPGIRRIATRDVESFETDVLSSEGRALPVLIAASSLPYGFLEKIARGAAGVIQVVQPSDRHADARLQAALKPQTVPDGGMRLYWPGFGLAGEVPRNPYWTRAQINAGARGGPSVINQVVGLVAQVATDRVPPDQGIMVVRREWLRKRVEEQRERERVNREKAREQRRKAQEAAKAARRDSGSGEQLSEAQNRIADLEDELAVADEERQEAARRADEIAERELRVVEEALNFEEDAQGLRQRVTQLEAENRNMRENLLAVQSFEVPENASAEEGAEVPALPSTVSSWEDVQQLLPDLEGPGFKITDRALDCGDGKGRYPYPNQMWRALRALERVGREYNERGGKIGQRFEDFATEVAGIEIALQDHSYEDCCYFEYEDKEYSRLPHVKIDDAKSPNEVGRIYFALDGDNGRLIVDWFGTKPDRPISRRRG